jgi:hypothetical protein
MPNSNLGADIARREARHDAHDVERGGLARCEHRVAEVVVEHERADAQGRRGLRGDGARDHGGPLFVQMVGHVQRRVAHVLALARQLAPGIPGCGAGGLHGEAEGGHGRGSYGVNLLR